MSSRPGVVERLAGARRWWDRPPIRVQGMVTVGLPIVAVVVSAVLAISGNQQRVGIEVAVQRQFEVSAALGELTSSMVNAETGMRGYLLTGEPAFLEPFDQARRDLPAALAGLGDLLGAETDTGPRADSLARLEVLRDVTSRQMADLAAQPGLPRTGTGGTVGPELRARLEYGKGLMDRIRAEVADMQAVERRILDARLAEIDAIRVRDYVSVTVVLVVALATRFLAWFLFRRGVLRRVEQLTESVRALRTGAAPPPPLPEKNDQLGLLDREIRLLERSRAVAPAEGDRA